MAYGRSVHAPSSPRLALAAVAVAGTVSACGSGSGVTSRSSNATVAAQTSATSSKHHRRSKHHHRRRTHRSTTNAHSRLFARAGRLVVSSASAHSVQGQPAPGSCHAMGSGLYAEPDPTCTPGSVNPAVTRATIAQTICVSGWTETVRPSESVTEPEKLASLAAYGARGSPHQYEYDHLVSLELGGALNDPRNLWPEPDQAGARRPLAECWI
jgi:hypothetical protein